MGAASGKTRAISRRALLPNGLGSPSIVGAASSTRSTPPSEKKRRSPAISADVAPPREDASQLIERLFGRARAARQRARGRDQEATAAQLERRLLAVVEAEARRRLDARVLRRERARLLGELLALRRQDSLHV